MPAAPLWTMGAVGIYIDGIEVEDNGIWAEIQVIDATSTTLHYYGAESPRWRFRGHLWGTSSVATLRGYKNADTTRTMTGPNAFNKDFKIKQVRSRRIPDKTDVTNEFWEVEIEAIEV